MTLEKPAIFKLNSNPDLDHPFKFSELLAGKLLASKRSFVIHDHASRYRGARLITGIGVHCHQRKARDQQYQGNQPSAQHG
jgi:hypothetical protein